MFDNVKLLPHNYKLQEDEIGVGDDDEFVAYWYRERGAMPIGLAPKGDRLCWIYANRDLISSYLKTWKNMGSEFKSYSKTVAQVKRAKKEAMARL